MHLCFDKNIMVINEGNMHAFKFTNFFKPTDVNFHNSTFLPA
jgi:hypothetical protein